MQLQEVENPAQHVVAPVTDAGESKKKPVPMHVVYVLVLLGMTIGSFTTPFIKLVLNMGIPSEGITFYRLFIVAVCLAPVCFSNRQYRSELKLAFSDVRTSLMLVILGVCKLLGILLAAYALHYVPILVYNTVLNLNPVYVIILAYFILHERTTCRAMIGVFICIVGVLIAGGQAISSAIISGNSHGTIFGVCMAVIAGFASALYMVVNKLLRAGFSLVTLMFVLFTFAASMDFVVCLINGVSMYLPFKAWFLTIVLALFCTLLAQGMPVWAIKYMSPSLYSLIGLLGIVLSAVDAFILLHEVPNLYTIVGAALLIVGLVVYIRAKKQVSHG